VVVTGGDSVDDVDNVVVGNDVDDVADSDDDVDNDTDSGTDRVDNVSVGDDVGTTAIDGFEVLCDGES